MALTRPRYSQIYDTDYKQSVRVATTADVGNLLATGNMTNTIDGKLLAEADRILVKDQSDAKQNGIYKVLTLGTGSNGTWVRTTDADANGVGKVTSGMTTTVADGDINISKTYKLSTLDPITIGVTELSFINPFVAGSAAGANTQVQFNDSGVAGATAGLIFDKTGNVLTVSNAIVITQLIGNANVTVTGSILPSANITYDLGSPTQRWREGWFSGSTIHIGDESISVDGNGKWTFTTDGAAVELGKNTDFNPPNANVSGNVTATNYLFANGTPLMTVVGTMIGVANTAMKGYADSALSTLTSNAAVQSDDIATLYANAGAQSGSIVTANTAMKGYVDGQISTTSSAITTANTAMKGYVDGQITSLVNGAPSTLDTLNELATALGNDVNLSATLTSYIGNVNANIGTANTAMKGYVDAITTAWSANAAVQAGDIATLYSNAAVQSGDIASTNTAITTANTAMKGYVDAVTTAWQSNAAVQAGDIATLFANAGAQSGSIATLTANAAVQAGDIAGKASLTGATFSGAIVPNANVTVNIGSVSAYWGTIYASTVNATTFTGTSTTAKYADLAEIYTSDKKYIPGTVVSFGGTKEVTITTDSHDTSIAGVISTNPAYLMNNSVDGVAVALQGRVPCRVQGPVKKGDRVVSSDVPGVAQRLDPAYYQPGCIIGKSLEYVPEGEIVTIEVVVGRN